MPSAWSNKRERQYEHIKDSEKKQGRSTRRAKEIAARTVNKQRSEAGETKRSKSKSKSKSSNSSKTSSSKRSSSNSRGRSARGGKTRQQLYQRAKRLDIEGRSKMNKDELAEAVRNHS